MMKNKRYKIPRTQSDLSFPIDKVYLIGDTTYFVALNSKTGGIIARDYDKELLCFQATYFEYLIQTGYIKLTDNGKVVDFKLGEQK